MSLMVKGLQSSFSGRNISIFGNISKDGYVFKGYYLPHSLILLTSLFFKESSLYLPIIPLFYSTSPLLVTTIILQQKVPLFYSNLPFYCTESFFSGRIPITPQIWYIFQQKLVYFGSHIFTTPKPARNAPKLVFLHQIVY